MMKTLLTFLFAFLLWSSAKPQSTVETSGINQIVKYKGGVMVDSMLKVPIRGTNALYGLVGLLGRIQALKSDSGLYYHDGKAWRRLMTVPMANTEISTMNASIASKAPQSRSITINSVTHDMASDMSFSVGTLTAQDTVSLSGRISAKLSISDTVQKWKPIGYVPSWSGITGKPALFSGNYSDLVGRPVLFDGDYNSLANRPTLSVYLPVSTAAATYQPIGQYLTAVTGPMIASALGFTPISSSYTGFDSRYRPASYVPAWTDITGKPVFFSGSYSDLTGRPSLFSGDYNDLSNRPALNTANWNLAYSWGNHASAGYLLASSAALVYKPISYQPSWNDVTGKPVIRKVEVFTGTTDANGNVTVVFSSTYPSAPFVVGSIPNQTDKNENIIVTSRSTTGFTVNVYTRPAITTLPILGTLTSALLGATTTPVSGRVVQVQVTES